MSAKHVQVNETTFSVGEDYKVIKVNYLVVNVLSPYNFIIVRPTINSSRVIISILYLILKYMLPSRRVGMVRGDRESSQEWYQINLTMRKGVFTHEASNPPEAHDIDVTSWDPRLGMDNK